MKIHNNNFSELETKTQSDNLENKLETGVKVASTIWTFILLLLLGIYLPLQIFTLIAVKIWQNQVGFPWDIPILLAIHQTAEPQLDVLAVILAKIGSPKTLIPILVLIALGLIFKKRWRLGAYLITTSVGSAIINLTAKEFMHRARPHLWESTYHKVGFAFPSGHAMASMTFITLLVILTWRTNWRLVTVIFGILFVLIIAWTRLYLGVHYPSDILAGWLFALAWCVSVYLIFSPGESLKKLSDNEK
ncbi:phosphoesterase [Calothrix sp. NIES-4101]|nr:phosphoesterase [Calothrix sp. NIES-4101]